MCHQRLRLRLLALAAPALLPLAAGAADADDFDRPIALPPFIVEEAAKGRPWRYTEAEGNEVLSRCSDPVTQKVVEAHHRLHQLLGEILPKALQLKLAVPKALILYDEELQPAASKEVIARLLRSTPAAPPVENLVPFGGGRSFRTPAAKPRYSFLPNLRRVSKSATEALKQDPKSAPALLPLADFFSGNVPRPEGEDEVAPESIRLWRAQAALFVRWGLDGRGAPRRAGLWKFVERSAIQGETEQLFEECFGINYAAALEQLTAYRPAALRNTLRFRLPRGAAPPALALRAASGAQIARIKGDWERMEVPFVKAVSPELTGKYLEQARRTLMRAYDRDERDPRLLAVLGLLECDAGNDVRALEFLEAAARIGSLRPRASYELARLRFAGHRTAAAATGGRLTSAQTAEVLTPLFAARRLDPPLPEVYELIGDVWAHCATAPNRGHLLVLNEGVRLFPRRTALIYRAASLNAQHGFREEAAALVTLGLRVAADAAARDPFERLQRELEAPR